MTQFLHEIFAFCNSGSNQAVAVFLLALASISGLTVVGVAFCSTLGSIGRRRR